MSYWLPYILGALLGLALAACAIHCGGGDPPRYTERN